jgi:hypothetical protein
MSSPQYSHDPYSEDQQGNVWEQSQPTGNVWDPQATDAWGQQAVADEPPYSLPPSPGGPIGQSAPPLQQPPQVQPSPNNVFAALFDFGFKTRVSTTAVRSVYLLGTVAAALLAVGILIFGFTSTNALLMAVALFLGPLSFLANLALMRVVLDVYRAIAGEPDQRAG